MKKFVKVITIVFLSILLGSFIGGYFFIKNFNLNQYKTTMSRNHNGYGSFSI